MKSTVGKAAVKRLTGGRPGAVAAFVTAAVVGLVTATATYRALRSGR